MSKLANSLARLAAALLVAAVLVAAAQPLFTDDLWWHLALGESYAADGPWLREDPLLFTAKGPPTPSAWLSDVALHSLESGLGLRGLRIAHAVLVAILFALAWVALRRASGSGLLASVGLCAFTPLSAFRLFQLRPHLLTMAAVLVLYLLLFSKPGAPSRLRIAATVLLFALWANLHSGFLLGPILLGAGLCGVVVAACWGPERSRASEWSRARGLALTLALGAVATLANPSGWEPHLAYFVAGEESPALAIIGDEWAPFRAFRFPNSPLPPSPLGWLLLWGLLIATPIAVLTAAIHSKRAAREADRVDFALLGLALACLPAMLIAVRFAWLAIFPILLVVRVGSIRLRAPFARPAPQWTAALMAAALAAAFFEFGSWHSVSSGIPKSFTHYIQSDYPAAKWFSHGVWFLKDAGVEGNLFNDYFMGGYLGFWSSPEIRAFQNGTLNIPRSTHEAAVAIRSRRGLPEGPSFEELLDDFEVDLVLGIRLPERQTGPWHYTTALMERAPGWLLVFRNLQTSVYLRNNPRNRANLDRIERYYAKALVPFDRMHGFEPRRVLHEAPGWARQHALVPVHFDALVSATQAGQTQRLLQAGGTLASVYASLGLYEDALRLDERLLKRVPELPAARRRQLFSLIRLDRPDEALAAAAAVEQGHDSATLAGSLAAEARRYSALDDPEAAAALAARSTFLTPAEARRIRSMLRQPESRTR